MTKNMHMHGATMVIIVPLISSVAQQRLTAMSSIEARSLQTVSSAHGCMTREQCFENNPRFRQLGHETELCLIVDFTLQHIPKLMHDTERPTLHPLRHKSRRNYKCINK